MSSTTSINLLHLVAMTVSTISIFIIKGPNLILVSVICIYYILCVMQGGGWGGGLQRWTWMSCHSLITAQLVQVNMCIEKMGCTIFSGMAWENVQNWCKRVLFVSWCMEGCNGRVLVSLQTMKVVEQHDNYLSSTMSIILLHLVAMTVWTIFFIIKGPKLILDSVLSIYIQCLIHMGEGNSGKATGEESSGIVALKWLDWCN